MTKKDLEKYLKKPSTIRGAAIGELQSLVNEYPYSATLRMLYLKGLQNEKDVSYEKELKKASIAIPDRMVLFQLLKESKESEELQEVIHEAVEQELEEEVKQEPQVQNDPLPPQEIEKARELRMEKEIKSTVIGSQYLLEVSDELPSIEDLMPKSKKKKKIAKQKKERQKTKKENLDFFSFLDGKKGPEKDDKEERLQEFIAKKEKALKGKKAIFSTERLAEKSLHENEDLVTETLAEIFVKQKKYGKAIKAYKRLSLKFPEKSVYFAARLKKVKKLKSKNK